MPRTLGLALLALICAVGPSQASSFTETGLSLLSYQLCTHTVMGRGPRVKAVQTPHGTNTPCGGWIPWRRCPKTVYRTQCRALGVPESRYVTGCCAGFEQLGFYCVQPPEGSPSSSWYNMTVLVQMDFEELLQVDPPLLSHMRLLHALVTGALRPLDSSAHHLHSAASGYASTTVSWLLLGLSQPVPVAGISAALDGMVRRVYKVIRMQGERMPGPRSPPGNASSTEHQDILALFLRMVWDSLPVPMCQHVDTGGILLEVTSMASGGMASSSVVVEFHLMVIADLDVREVAAAFLEAFQSSSRMEVARGDTFIGGTWR